MSVIDKMIASQELSFENNYPSTFEEYKNYIDLMGPPPASISNLVAFQKKYFIISDKKFSKTLTDLFSPDLNSKLNMTTIKRSISNIENMLKFDPNIQKLDVNENNLQEINDNFKLIKKNLQKIYKQFANSQRYPNIVAIKTALAKLETYINKAELTIATSKKGKVIFSGDDKTNIFASLNGIATALKGFELEVKAAKIINNNGLGAINSGAFSIKGKFPKEDILVFDVDDLNKYNITIGGKTQTLSQWISDFEASSTEISITNDEYNQLLEIAKAGISAKSGFGKKITFHSSLSLNTLSIQDQNFNDEYHWVIYQLNQLKKRKIVIPNEDEISLYINYVINRHLTYIIGEKNLYLLTRNGIESTRDYLDRLNRQIKYLYYSGQINKSFEVVGPNI